MRPMNLTLKENLVVKTWHITTKLMLALILEISKCRESTFDELELGKNSSMFNFKVVFYNTLRVLDVMGVIISHNFKDHPAVSTELVKYLSTNTAVELVDNLIESADIMKSEMMELKLVVAGAVKTF